ncbi:MAG: hypothetical protein JWQ12_1445 [Glaciihabitans sp.]|nr:hypothetical protein [Glaciihabitans sp.]
MGPSRQLYEYAISARPFASSVYLASIVLRRYCRAMTNAHDTLRAQALERIKRKQEFWRFFWTWIGLSVFLTAIWFFTGAPRYFWPAWPITGVAIGVFFGALNAYGPGKRIITDDDIDAEIARSSRKSRGYRITEDPPL